MAASTIGLAGLAAMLAGCGGLLWTGPRTGYDGVVGQQALIGAGLGLLVPALTQTLLGSVEVAQSGIASGTLTTMRQTGSMVGVALFGTLIATPGHFFAGLHAALLVSIAALLLGVAFAPFLSAVPGRASPASRRVTSISS